MTTIDPRYVGTGGMDYFSPQAEAYREAARELGKEHPDVYVRATQILQAAECDFPQDVDANGNLTHAECACPTGVR